MIVSFTVAFHTDKGIKKQIFYSPNRLFTQWACHYFHCILNSNNHLIIVVKLIFNGLFTDHQIVLWRKNIAHVGVKCRLATAAVSGRKQTYAVRRNTGKNLFFFYKVAYFRASQGVWVLWIIVTETYETQLYEFKSCSGQWFNTLTNMFANKRINGSQSVLHFVLLCGKVTCNNLCLSY